MLQKLLIIPCSVFLNNVCQSGGVVSLSYFPFLFSGINILQNSTGPAIMVIPHALHDVH